MKPLQLLLFLFPVLGSAQEYQLVRSNFIHFFQSESGDTLRTHGFKPDSVIYLNGDSVFYNYVHTRQNEGGCEIMPFSPSFLGSKVVVGSDGWTYLFNQNLDTISINTQSLPNDSFVSHRISEDSLVTTTVTGIQQETWLDSITNVKTFEFQLTNSMGVELAHPVNDLVLKISETLGVLEMPDMFIFPNDSALYSLVGMEQPNRGVHRMTYDEVYDFEVGNEFHHLENVSGYNGYSHTIIERWRVTSVENSGTTRTIVSEVMINQQASGTPYNYDTIYTALDTAHIVDVNETVTDFLPAQADSMWTETDWPFQVLNYSPVVYSSFLCNRPQVMISDYSYFEWEPDTLDGDLCYSEFFGVSPWDGEEHSYSVGLGMTQVYQGSYGDGTSFSLNRNLVYFKKGVEECGEPFTLSELLGTPLLNEDNLELFPNPVRVGTLVRLGSSNNSTITVSTLSGKLVGAPIHNGRLETTSLTPGLYLVRIETETGIVTKKLSVVS